MFTDPLAKRVCLQAGCLCGKKKVVGDEHLTVTKGSVERWLKSSTILVACFKNSRAVTGRGTRTASCVDIQSSGRSDLTAHNLKTKIIVAKTRCMFSCLWKVVCRASGFPVSSGIWAPLVQSSPSAWLVSSGLPCGLRWQRKCQLFGPSNKTWRRRKSRSTEKGIRGAELAPVVLPKVHQNTSACSHWPERNHRVAAGAGEAGRCRTLIWVAWAQLIIRGYYRGRGRAGRVGAATGSLPMGSSCGTCVGKNCSFQMFSIIWPSKVSQALGHVAQTPDLTNGFYSFATLHSLAQTSLLKTTCRKPWNNGLVSLLC